MGHDLEAAIIDEKAAAHSPGRKSKGIPSRGSIGDGKGSISCNKDDNEEGTTSLDIESNDWEGLLWAPADVSEKQGTLWSAPHRKKL